MEVSSKINGIDGGRPAAVGAGGAVKRSTDPAAGGAQAAGTGAPDVHITGAATRLVALEQALLEMPAIDEARVAEIRLSLEEGCYTINSDRITDQLLQLEQALRQAYPSQE